MARVRPLLDAMGDTVVHCGPVGTGIRCKVVNNFLTMITAKANAEALSMAMKAGLPADTVWRVITGTTATNGCLSTGWLPKLFSGDLEPGFAMRLARKDLALGVRLAGELGVDTPLADLALAHYDGLLGSKYADKGLLGHRQRRLRGRGAWGIRFSTGLDRKPAGPAPAPRHGPVRYLAAEQEPPPRTQNLAQ